MVKIRLRRVGAKKRPMYRIVAADSRMPRDGRFIENLGHYNPLTEPATVVYKEDRVRYWLDHGAQATEVVQRLLSRPPAPAPAPEPEAVTPAPARRRRTAAARATADAPPAVEAPAAEETAEPSAPPETDTQQAEAAAPEVPAEETPGETP